MRATKKNQKRDSFETELGSSFTKQYNGKILLGYKAKKN